MELDIFEKVNIYAIPKTIQALFDPNIAKPDFVWENVNELTAEIRDQFELIVFDLDRTLVLDGSDEISPDLKYIWEEIRSGSARIACFTNKSNSRNKRFGDKYDVPVYSGLPKKPHPAKFREILSDYYLAGTPQKTLFVDDSLLTGIVGAKGVGMQTALVNYMSISKTPEMITKRLFGRPLESLTRRRLGLHFSKKDNSI
ncbi:MAG: HAD-IA family hydrolase [Candidatus Gracilibacteria bacterium]|nr:HAD-IA family hydrolase [Candidatus Gracilibacteria bacterium]